jgi:subtilisin-like proprotein convertase family protein
MNASSQMRLPGALLAGLLLHSSLYAAPADPDPSFGTAGVAPAPVFLLADEALRFERMALMADERIALAGRKTTGPAGAREHEPVLAVIAEDGGVVNQGFIFDSAWSPAFTPAGEDGWLNRVLTLPDGKILYCGGHTGPGGLFNGDRAVIGRLGADLNPDTGFGQAGTQGWRTLALGLGNIDCHALEQLPGGKILIGGSYVDQDLGQDEFNKGSFLAMFDAQGNPDPSFGSNGMVVRLRQAGSLATARYSIVALRHQQGGDVLAIDMDRSDAIGGNQVFLVGSDGSVPEIAPDLFGGVNFQRDFYLTGTPSGQFQVLGTEFTGSTSRRFAADSPNAPVWERYFNLAGKRLAPAGMSLTHTGRSLVGLHQYDPSQPNGGQHRMELRTQGNDGQAVSSFTFPSGLSIPGGQQEILDPADALVQTNGRYLVLMNRTMIGATPSVERPVLRRFLGNDSSGTAWALDLSPNAPSFPPVSVRPNETVLSDLVVVSGLTPGVRVPVDVSGGDLQHNFGEWTGAPVMVANDDVLRLRGTAPASDGASTTVQVRMGGLRQSSSWNRLASSLVQSGFVITAGQPTLPGARCSDSPANTNCSAAIPDNDNTGVSSTINLIGSCNYIAGVRVGVDLSHPYVGDLQLTLRDPNGQVFIGGSVGFVQLMQRPLAAPGANAGSCAGDNVLATFDQTADVPADTACGLIPGAAAIAGVVGPTESLSSLIGRRGTGNEGALGNGLWTLIVSDRAGSDVGTLNDWSIDVDCSSTPPALSDLSMTVSSPVQLIGGTELASNALSFTVSNAGPAQASFGRFEMTTPALIEAPLWRCTATAGSSCVLPPGGCNFNLCPGPLADPGLNLLPGGSATIEILGTLSAAAPEGSVLDLDAQSWIAPGIGGSSDPDDNNNDVHFAQAFDHSADLVAESINAVRDSSDRLRVDVRFRNAGPSAASHIRSTVNLPAGYSILAWTCAQAFGGSNASANQLVVLDQGAAGDSASLSCTLLAGFSLPQPGGNISLQVDHGPGTVATDPNAANNQISVPVPTQIDSIFEDGFD